MVEVVIGDSLTYWFPQVWPQIYFQGSNYQGLAAWGQMTSTVLRRMDEPGYKPPGGVGNYQDVAPFMAPGHRWWILLGPAQAFDMYDPATEPQPTAVFDAELSEILDRLQASGVDGARLIQPPLVKAGKRPGSGVFPTTAASQAERNPKLVAMGQTCRSLVAERPGWAELGPDLAAIDFPLEEYHDGTHLNGTTGHGRIAQALEATFGIYVP